MNIAIFHMFISVLVGWLVLCSLLLRCLSMQGSTSNVRVWVRQAPWALGVSPIARFEVSFFQSRPYSLPRPGLGCRHQPLPPSQYFCPGETRPAESPCRSDL